MLSLNWIQATNYQAGLIFSHPAISKYAFAIYQHFVPTFFNNQPAQMSKKHTFISIATLQSTPAKLWHQ